MTHHAQLKIQCEDNPDDCWCTVCHGAKRLHWAGGSTQCDNCHGTGGHYPCTNRKDELLKLIVNEIYTLEESQNRAVQAQQRITEWRNEYDNLNKERANK